MTDTANNNLRTLATGLKNGEGDPEALIINYSTAAGAESAAKIPEKMMEKILLPRQRVAGLSS